MHVNRTCAILLRQFYLLSGNPARIVPLFAWVAIVWRKQNALGARLQGLERVLDQAADEADKRAKGGSSHPKQAAAIEKPE